MKLKLQYFGHWCEEPTHWNRPCCWEGLKAGGEGDDRGWDSWMASPTQRTWVWTSSGHGEGQGSLVCRGSWGHRKSDMIEQLNNNQHGTSQGYFHNVETFSIAVCWDQIKELFLSKKRLGKNKVTYPLKKERKERCSFCSPVFSKTVNNAQECDFLLFWKGNWYYLNSISFVYCPVNMFASWA